jgi:hypothetical protein
VYTITLASTLTYSHQTYAWLSIQETISKTVTAEACTPEPIEDLIPMIEVLRQKSIECNGDFPDFEKAQTLFSHLTDMLRVLLIGGATQEGIYDVYEDLMAILRNHVPCVHTNLPIPPYDLGDYAVSQFPIDAAFCQNVGDGVNTVYSISHNLNDDCVLVQVYEVTSGAQVLTDVTITSNNSVNVSFATAPATDAYKVVVHSGNGGMVGPGVAAGGTTGQYLRKTSATDYDTYWDTLNAADIPDLSATYMTKAVYDTDNDGIVDDAEKIAIIARNSTGSTIHKGKIVYLQGSTGNRPNILLAQANSEASSSKTFGVVVEDIAHNADGQVAAIGTLHDLDTRSNAPHPFTTDTLLDGDKVWLSATDAGYITRTPPVQPNHTVFIGFVARTTPSFGRIIYNIQNGFELDELHNVLITSAADKDILYYDLATGLWKNTAKSGWLGGTASQFVKGDGTLDSSTYLTTGTAASTYVALGGSYSNPSWITALAWSKITGAPAFLTTETDPIFTAHPAFGITGTKISNWDSAYGFTSAFPSQSGNSGKFLTTNGSALSWADVVSGVSSFNTRTGAVTLTSGDVTGALGYTPISTNIYTDNGTLTGDRTITMGAFTLSFEKDIFVNNNRVGRGNGNDFRTVVLGQLAGSSTTTGNQNVFVGFSAGNLATTANSNVLLGAFAGRIIDTGSGNTIVGHVSGYSLTSGTFNTFIGRQSGFGITTGIHNTIISTISSGSIGITTGSYNTVIGSQVSGLTATLSNNIILADGQGNIRIRAWDTGNVGIGTTTDAGYKLDVNGTARVSGDVTFDNAVYFRSTNGNNKFTIAANTGWITQISTGSWGSAAVKFGDGQFANILIGQSGDSPTGVASLDLRSNVLGLYLNRGTIATMPNLSAWQGVTLSIIGGTGYTNGTYSGVVATGNFTGSVNVSVTVSGGIVTGVFIFGGETKIQLGETFTVPAASIGGTGSGMSFTITAINNSNPAFTFYNTSTNLLTYWDGRNYASPIVSKLDRVLIGGIGLANATSILELSSTTQGFLPPRMTTTQRDAIASPATGLVIYNTTTLAANVYNGTSWVGMGGDNIYTADGTLSSTTRVLSYSVSGANENKLIFRNTGVTGGPNDDFIFQASTNTAPVLQIWNPNYGGVLNLGAGSVSFGGGRLNLATSGHDIRMQPGGVETARFFTSTGNVLIQTGGTFTDAGYKLDVQGTARVSGALYTGTTSNVGIWMLTETAIRGTATTGGNLYIDANSSLDGTGTIHLRGLVNSGRLTVSGNLTVTGAQIFVPFNGGLRVNQASNGNLFLDASLDFTGNVFARATSFVVELAGGVPTTFASAIVAFNSTTKGFLPPRLTTTERNAITSPATGLQVYNSTTNTNDFYNGTAWVSNAAGNIYTTDGTLTGNRTVTMGSNTLSFEKDVYINSQRIGKGAGNQTSNFAAGSQTLNANTTGNFNTAVGNTALRDNTTGSLNTAVGVSALLSNTDAFVNTAVGASTFMNLNSGSGNTAVGDDAGRYFTGSASLTTANNSIFIGRRSAALGNNQTNQIVIGNDATGLGSNTTVIGNSSTVTSAIYGRLLLGTTTDSGLYQLDVNGTARVSGMLTVNNLDGTFSVNRTGSNGSNSLTISPSNGTPATASAQNSIAIGASSQATVVGCISIGNGATATGEAATALGSVAGASGVAAIAIGYQSVAAANEFVAANYFYTIQNVYFGSGKIRNSQAGAGTAYTINGSGANGTNFAGGNITIAGGKGTGTGTAGDIIFSTATSTASGTTLQTLTDRVWIKGENGNVGIGASPNAAYKLDVNGTARFTDHIYIADTKSLYGVGTTYNINISSTNGIYFRDATADRAGLKADVFRFENSVYTNIGTRGLLIGSFAGATNASALLEVTSTTKGFLPPRMTTTEKNAIGTPAAGLVVYDNTLTALNVYNGTSWVTLGASSAYSVASVTTTYSETATSGTKIIKADTTSGAFTINLPTAVGNTATIIIKKVAGSGALTIDGNGTETIDGGTTATINKVYESITLISDNSNWQIV